MTVPDVLLSGDHGAIAQWRREQSLLRSQTSGPERTGEHEKQIPGSSGTGAN